MDYFFECESCLKRQEITEEQARVIAGDKVEGPIRARRTLERLHGWVSPPNRKGMVCPECLVRQGAQGALFDESESSK